MLTTGMTCAVQGLIDSFTEIEERIAGRIIMEVMHAYDDEKWNTMTGEERADWLYNFIHKR